MTKKSWAFVILTAIAVGMFEATFITLLPKPWRDFRPIIDVAVLLVVINRPKAALVYAGIAGSILDAFSVGGVFAFARLLLVVAVVWALSETVVTNRSVYATAAMVIVARAIERLWIWLAQIAGAGLFHWDIHQEPLSAFFTTLAWDVGTVSVVFLLLAFFTRRFLMAVVKPYNFYERG